MSSSDSNSAISHSRLPRVLAAIVIYLIVIAATVTIAAVRMRVHAAPPAAGAKAAAAATTATTAAAITKPTTEYKPYFALSTNRTYSTSDRTRVWINYLGIDFLDFRLYRVKDPSKFFAKLKDPHKMGEPEKQAIAASLKTTPSAAEKLHAFKVSVFKSIKSYFRDQLKRETRESLNQKLRGDGDQVPLNVADFARLPLLNPDQLVRTWREKLPPLDNEYDTRMVMLGKSDPGVYLVEAVNGDLRAYTIAVVTDLTMIIKASPTGEMLVYTVDRKSGEPREGVDVEIVKSKTLAKGKTDKNGILKTRLGKPAGQGPDADPESSEGRLVMARSGDQFAISDLSSIYFGEGEGEGDMEGEGYTAGGITGYIYTDRPVYRPAQKVYFKGILRRAGDRGYEIPTGNVGVTIEDPNSGKVLSKSLTLSARGTFSGEVDIAAGAPLGSYRIVARVGSSETSGEFEVQEYKKPEYKVAVTTPKKFAKSGEKVKFSIEARYFFGEPVKNADVTYYIYRSRYYPWWWERDEDEEQDENEGGEESSYGYGNDMVKDGQEKLNANGKLDVEFEVPAAEENSANDYSYRLEAQVTDQSRRTEEGKASFVGTRGNVVAQTQTDRYVYYAGDTAKIQIRTTDYEGKPLGASLTLEFLERHWDKVEKQYEDGQKYYEYTSRDTKLSSADVNTDNQGEGVYEYHVTKPGSIYIKTIVKEGKSQFVATDNYLWVADRADQWSDWAYQDSGSIKLVPDKKSYQPGETAHVLAMLPTANAHLLVTAELSGVMSARRVDASARAVMIDVPVDPRYAPNVYLNVAYVQNGEMYTHDRLLKVPATNKFLNLEIIADKKEYKPQETAHYTILARNMDGSAASGAEVSLGIVDEAIYSVRPEQTRDIKKAFYGRRYNQVQTTFALSYYFTGYSGDKPASLAKANKPAYQLADFKNEGQYAEPTIRKDFKDTTFWQPSLMTGADGKATVEVKLPDNLTTWRATARAVTADTKVGAAIAKVVARKDLILRLETPRFLTEGDTVTLSAIVHNYLESDKSTKISIELTGARLLDPASQTVNIAKKGEHRIDWRVAANQVGEIKLLAAARTDGESDAVQLPLEVLPHGLHKTSAESLAITDESAEKTFSLDLPDNAHPAARVLRIEAAPSTAATLFGALDYLTSYPYGCTEQTMSSFLPNVIVTQALKEVKAASIRDSNDLPVKVQRGLDRLYAYQHDDGGWGWWKDDKTDPFMSAYVVDGLIMATRAGYKVERERLKRGRDKLAELIGAGKTEEGKTIDPETRAFMIYALSESGDVDGSLVNDLFAKRGELQPYGRALLALTLKLRRDDNRARQVAGEIEGSAQATDYDAHWESKRRPMLDFTESNDTEATAFSLKALARISPQSQLLPKVARWLVSNRRNGYYWDSTKQTAFAVLGLTEYLKVSRELTPDYNLQIFVNGEQVLTRRVSTLDATGGQPFVLERKSGQVGRTNQVKVVKSGAGVLYFSATLNYYTREDNVAAQGSSDLSLTREYLRLRVVDSGGSAKWSVEPLSGELRSGDLIVSRLHLRGGKTQYVMVEDPIPAGCEQVERVSGIDLNYTANHWCDWYSSREFRDQRTAFFLNFFSGDTTLQYALRVQVPGDFKVLPARAELMYQPAVQANTASTALKLLDKK
ncbi:MAG TPA: MG2 domain-containing protein [Blastocatellia bacterium]|nr:MG2 domain-containing protein [Blastocatellia bacterium]